MRFKKKQQGKEMNNINFDSKKASHYEELARYNRERTLRIFCR